VCSRCTVTHFRQCDTAWLRRCRSLRSNRNVAVVLVRVTSRFAAHIQWALELFFLTFCCQALGLFCISRDGSRYRDLSSECTCPSWHLRAHSGSSRCGSLFGKCQLFIPFCNARHRTRPDTVCTYAVHAFAVLDLLLLVVIPATPSRPLTAGDSGLARDREMGRESNL
jgi:hypothetical protein